MTITPSEQIPRDQLAAIAALARKAGRVILDHYATGAAPEMKRDGTPVTLADRDAESVIAEGLQTLDPAIPLVAEEQMAAGARPDISGGTFWLVDPLDGTREFIEQTGDFTVNIALIHACEPLLGLVHSPVTGEMFAGAGGRAYQITAEGDWSPIAARRFDPDSDGLVVVASRRHGNTNRLETFLGARPIKRLISRGSSLKFTELARGAADIYPRFGPTCEWDTAAGHAILSMAGGAVLTLDNQPLLYGKPEFLNPEFIAVADPAALNARSN